MVIFIGVVVSLLVQWIKVVTKSNNALTLTYVAIVSLAGAGLYVYFSAQAYWSTVLTVLTTAGAFYTFVISQFESSTPTVQNSTVAIDPTI